LPRCKRIGDVAFFCYVLPPSILERGIALSALAQEIARELLTRLEPLSLRRVECEEQIARFQEEIRRIDLILSAANTNGAVPKPARNKRVTAKRASGGRGRFGTDIAANAAKRRELTENYLRTHARQLKEGFAAPALARMVSTPDYPISAERMREILTTLLDEAVVYVDGRVRGGGDRYKLVTATPAQAGSLDEDLLATAIAS